VPKSDLHNHCWMGGRIAYIEGRMGIAIERPPAVNDADVVSDWVSSTFIPRIYEAEGRQVAIEAAFVQAADDGVTVLAMSLGVFMLGRIYGGDIRRDIGAFKRLHSCFAPHVDLHPVLGFNRGLCHPNEVIGMLEDHLEIEFFEAIDLYGDEFARPIQDFKALYRRAKAYGLGLTAHVGEFGNAESVKEAVNELELQHRTGHFTALELDDIRRNGLTAIIERE